MIGNGFENAFHMNEESVEATAMEEKVEVPKETAPKAATPEVAFVVVASKEPVPYFRVTPLWKKEPIFVDENEYNLFTSKWGSAKIGVFLCATELKYRQCAILAIVGYSVSIHLRSLMEHLQKP